ncbi:MAG: DUF2007 domain-containing protein [Reinekea sp.]|jgi:hypothetical protein
MRIYSHPLLYQVVNVQNLLKLNGIESMVRNEYAGGAAGDLAITWVELWLMREQDQEAALKIIEQVAGADQTEDWFCSRCGEANNGSFELCWNCQKESPSESV